MGTRSTYRVIQEITTGKKVKKLKQEPLCLIYLQYDGYPSGHPCETAEWLASGKVVNGFGMTEELQFNGAGCLAAQLIAKYKQGVGGTYLHALGERGKCWEDYLYDIIVKEDYTIEYVAYENDVVPTEIFRGTPSEFVAKYQKEESNA